MMLQNFDTTWFKLNLNLIRMDTIDIDDLT